MTNTQILLAALTVVALIAAHLVWDSWRSGRAFCTPIPHPFRARNSQEHMWRQQWEPPAMEKVDAVLKALCDAFGFNPDQRYQFAPTDRPHEIYRRYYRWQRSVDSMEIESLAIHLKEEFGVDIAQGYPEITLGEIVRRAVDRDGTDVPPTSAKNSQ